MHFYQLQLALFHGNGIVNYYCKMKFALTPIIITLPLKNVKVEVEVDAEVRGGLQSRARCLGGRQDQGGC